MDRAVLGACGCHDLPAPPYCPLTPEDRAAVTAYEDEVIDRLYVLNATRARAESRLGTAKPPRKPPTPRKPGNTSPSAERRLYDEGSE